MNKKVIFLITLIGLLLLTVACSDNENNNSSENDKPAEKTILKETPKKSPYESIIMNEDHPHYLDDNEDVLSFAKQHSKKEVAVDIIGGDSYSKYGDKTIVSYKGFDHDGYITGIEIYLEKNGAKLDIEDALSLADDYLNTELIRQNYSVEESSRLVSKDESKTENIVIKYKLNGEKKDDNEFKKPNSFYVILEFKDDVVDLVWLTRDRPKWMNFLEKNEYEKEEFNLN